MASTVGSDGSQKSSKRRFFQSLNGTSAASAAVAALNEIFGAAAPKTIAPDPLRVGHQAGKGIFSRARGARPSPSTVSPAIAGLPSITGGWTTYLGDTGS